MQSDPESGLGARLRQQLQPVLLQSLKRVRRSARLVSATAQQLATGRFHRAGRRQNLLARLHRARSGAKRQFASPYRDTGNLDHRVVRLHLAADQLVRFRDADRLGHTHQVFKLCGVDRPGVAGNADRRPLRTRHHVRPESQALDFCANAGDIFRAGVGAHHNKHRFASYL